MFRLMGRGGSSTPPPQILYQHIHPQTSQPSTLKASIILAKTAKLLYFPTGIECIKTLPSVSIV
ncbi:MAG: hypothetical protein R2865_04375 [Deinococcales bacterium]